ncbi:MAG: HNH endonuclease [Gemmatimonadetes bacterium]|nr:HNH endonuclease [Gemmatimonadota bacterium]MBA4159790.1 HNH endonuclease [Gemmatimonadota bacterium]
MPLLYYWHPKNHRRDLDYGAGYHLNQKNHLLHQVDFGDSLWAFTRTADARYVLAAELVVRAKTHNRPGFKYGPYRVWGDLKLSRYFQVQGQPSVEQIIRSLSVTTRAAHLGQSFQGLRAVKPLSIADHQVLVEAARDLPLEPRARILPEERLEAALLLGDREAVYQLIREENPGVARERQRYLYQAAPVRNRSLAEQLHELYDGRCQVCEWNPRDEYGRNLCHAHHIQWLSRGGADDIDNLVLICPNHHSAVHSCDAPLDFRAGWFDFGSHTERLRLNSHLTLWAA